MIVFSPRVLTLSVTHLPVASSKTRLRRKLGICHLRVRLLAWLTLWALCRRRPVTGHVLDIISPELALPASVRFGIRVEGQQS
jgi:hypothetical protein